MNGLDPHLAANAVRRADAGDKDDAEALPLSASSWSLVGAPDWHRAPRRLPVRLGRRRGRAAAAAPSAGAVPARSCAFLPGIAFFGLLRGVALGEAGGVEEAEHAVGRLRAHRQPMLDPLGLERDALLVALGQDRIVGADDLDEAAVARASG